MSFLVITIVAFFTGFIASLGLGGGMVLIIYLTIFAKVPQLSAQGINLLFFIPIAAFSLFFHTKNRLVEWRKIIPSIFFGIAGAFGGSMIAKAVSSEMIKRLFAIFIIFIGIRELFSTKKDKNA